MLREAIDTLVYLWMGHAASTITQRYFNQSKQSSKQSSKQKRTSKHATQVLFFPDSNIPCKKVVEGEQCENKNCSFSHTQTSLTTLLQCLRSAQKSLDVAVFIITSQDIAHVLIDAHKRGVVVRVITDCENMDLNCSQIEQFRANGIQVQHILN